MTGLGADAPACPPAAPVPSAEERQSTSAHARDRGFLWKAEKDGRASYLYGTMHVAKIDWIAPGPKVLDAVKASDVVALEIDVLDPAMLERIRAGMMPRPDPALPQLERYDRWCECLDTALRRERSARMIEARNPAMTDRIDELHASGKRVFAAVGSLHMIGDAGLASLLAERGYRVARVPFAR